MPRQWWPTAEAVNAVLGNGGPWPLPSPKSNGIFVPLDVDIYDDLAIVVGYGPNWDGREVLGVDEFQKTLTNTWNRLAGSGSGVSLDSRKRLADAPEALHLRMGGSAGKFLMEPERPSFSFAVFLSGSEVQTVEVHRRLSTRRADISVGPGWIGVLYLPGDPAVVKAFSAGGKLTFTWTSPDNDPS